MDTRPFLPTFAGWLVTVAIVVVAQPTGLAIWEVALLTLAPWAAVAAINVVATFEKASAKSSISVIDFTRQLEPRRYEPGEIIIAEGEEADCFYILSSGRVQVFKDDEYGARLDIAELTPGSFFGEMGLLSGARRNASIEAMDTADVLTMSKALFQQVVADNQETRDVVSSVARKRSKAP